MKWGLTRSHGPTALTAAHKQCGQPQKREPSGITGGFSTDFFGASSVASALGFRSGATPSGRLQPNIRPSTLPHKEDISKSVCRGLGSRWFTERFNRNALVTHFQDDQVFFTARRLESYAVARCRLHQR